MTCIVGLVYDGLVYIGGDSAGVSDYDSVQREDRKVFKNGPFIMGFTSSFRMGQLLAYKFIPPVRHPDIDIMKFMVTDFIDAVRHCFKDGGYASINHGEETGGTFLVGYEGRLFYIDSDYQVGENNYGYSACGCGESYALGSMRNSDHLTPKERITQALETAEDFSAGVRGPFFVEVLGEVKKPVKQIVKKPVRKKRTK
jgi:ATP-dependent protease HslVU (ClpYQ) peptidase subunit